MVIKSGTEGNYGIKISPPSNIQYLAFSVFHSGFCLIWCQPNKDSGHSFSQQHKPLTELRDHDGESSKEQAVCHLFL